MNAARPGLAVCVPPGPDLLDQKLRWHDGPGDAGHFGRGQGLRRRGKLAGTEANTLQVSRRAFLWIEQAHERSAKRADFDLVEVQRRQVLAERPRLDRRQPAGRPNIVERQRQRFCRVPVVRHDIHQFRAGAGLVGESGQPQRPELTIGHQVALVKQHDDRLVGRRRPAKKLLHGRVVVLLLREDRDQNVRGLANHVGTLPIHRRVGIDIRRVQQQQPRRYRGASAKTGDAHPSLQAHRRANASTAA